MEIGSLGLKDCRPFEGCMVLLCLMPGSAAKVGGLLANQWESMALSFIGEPICPKFCVSFSVLLGVCWFQVPFLLVSWFQVPLVSWPEE